MFSDRLAEIIFNWTAIWQWGLFSVVLWVVVMGMLLHFGPMDE
jgi:hypothetical protein